MRLLRAILPLIITTVTVCLLNKPIGSLPALGRLLDPANGCWANAEPVNKDYNLQLQLPSLQHPVTVWVDAQLVPHIHAANDHDLYFMQGYIHAYFRLWQMDMQTRAAAGRVSEVIGDKTLHFDREQRRKGMVYGAEQSLKAMEADPRTKQMLDAYATGINHYISMLKYKDYPLEYKLLGFNPQKWTNLKSALLLKYMADDLTGETQDIQMTGLRDLLTKEELDNLFPEKQLNSTPVIPVGTQFEKPSLSVPPVPGDTSIFAHLAPTDFEPADNEGKGSNNWALSGSKTRSGATILCNDPHLGLNLPSLWFQVQLQAPGINVYGVSLPGAPGVVIGFTDSISWGCTNNYRDVKDFYAVQLSADRSTYLFNGKQEPVNKRIEKIRVKGKPDFVDTVLYTLHGPVMYDEHFHGPGGLARPLAMCWMAHRSSNELLSIYLLNRSRNYNEFVAAIMEFKCPAQNMIYADKTGNVALWGQGQFINKWKGQGRYVMNGTDSNTLWKELIPMNENPHVLNPQQGFISSANQTVTDSTYPYYYNGYFYEFRAWRINQVLGEMQHATVQDMFKLQNDTYSILAANTLPFMLQAVQHADLNANEKQYIEALGKWNYFLAADSKEASVYQLWWDKLYKAIWREKFAAIRAKLSPSPERTMQLIKTDTAFVKHISPLVITSYRAALDSLHKADKNGDEWYHIKNTTVKHLTRLPAFSYPDLKIGGWGNTVNAAKGDHGPSWRMVVEMSKDINAYGVYPGGQSGNPGSKYYASFLDNWVKGDYYKLIFLPNVQVQKNDAIKYTWTIQPE